MTIDRVIGVYDKESGVGRIPWNNKKEFTHPDMKRFKELTLNSNVIMGRKTWDSMGHRALSNRKNFIVSKTLKDGFYEGQKYRVCEDIDTLFSWSFIGNIWVIGGREVYASSLKWAEFIDITIVPMLSEDLCSESATKIFFPVIDNKMYMYKSFIHPYNEEMRVLRYVRR